jgi:Mn-containing catalase
MNTTKGVDLMFKHDKHLLHEVKVERANPQYAVMLQEQLGGGDGELAAAMQYIAQSFRVKDPAIKDLFLDIGSEELGHMEMVATMVNMLNGHEVDYTQQNNGSIEAHVFTGLAPALTNASGYPWNATYVNATGDLVADLLSNMAGEQRAKVVYEYLHRQINDKGVRQNIDFLLNREEAHNALFREALEKVRHTGSNRDFGTTADSQYYFNLSTPGRYFANPNTSPERRADR